MFPNQIQNILIPELSPETHFTTIHYATSRWRLMEQETAGMWWSSASSILPTQSRSRSTGWRGDVLPGTHHSGLSTDMAGSYSLSDYGWISALTSVLGWTVHILAVRSDGGLESRSSRETTRTLVSFISLVGDNVVPSKQVIE